MIQCPVCQSVQTYVVDSRQMENGTDIRRRRTCESCGHRWNTMEISKEYYDELRQYETIAQHAAPARFRAILRRTIIELERLEQRLSPPKKGSSRKGN